MNGLVITISLIISFILQVIALPEAVNFIRPYPILMMVLFWSFIPEARFHIHYAWGIGLLTDILLSSTFGLHGFIFALTAFIVKKSHPILKSRNILEQTVCIMLCFFLQTLFIVWVNGMLGFSSALGRLWYFPALLSTLLWPLFFSLMAHICFIIGITDK